jgi:hypothetical protein
MDRKGRAGVPPAGSGGVSPRGPWPGCAISGTIETPNEPVECPDSNDSPSPRPSPAGRGRIVHRWLVTANGRFSSWPLCMHGTTSEGASK